MGMMEGDLVSVEGVWLFLVWGNPTWGQGRLPTAQHSRQLLQELELVWRANEAACPRLSGKRGGRVKSKKWVFLKWRPNIWVLKVELWVDDTGQRFSQYEADLELLQGMLKVCPASRTPQQSFAEHTALKFQLCPAAQPARLNWELLLGLSVCLPLVSLCSFLAVSFPLFKKYFKISRIT